MTGKSQQISDSSTYRSQAKVSVFQKKKQIIGNFVPRVGTVRELETYGVAEKQRKSRKVRGFEDEEITAALHCERLF